MDWLCDEMLGRLARLLRAAGHDTVLAAGGTEDNRLLAQARGEGRVLLTRDRPLAAKAAADGFLVTGETVEEQARSLTAAFRLDWLHAPFTRCLVDNTPVRPASAAEVAGLPLPVRDLGGPFTTCPACGRLYWPGGHVRRLALRLEALTRACQSESTGWNLQKKDSECD
jgi:Uncharacterized conserved protein